MWLQEVEDHGLWASLADVPGEPPFELHKAVDEFNRRLFWECHETLEGLWRDSPYPLRFFYHAIIKVAVGFHHLSRHNRYGAHLKLWDGVRLLRLFPLAFLGVRTDLLGRDTAAWLERVEGDGHIDWRELDALPTPRICREDRPGYTDQ